MTNTTAPTIQTIHSVGYDIEICGDFSSRRDRWFTRCPINGTYEHGSQAEAIMHATNQMLADCDAETNETTPRLAIAQQPKNPAAASIEEIAAALHSLVNEQAGR